MCWARAEGARALGRGRIIDVSFGSDTFVVNLLCRRKGRSERKEFRGDPDGRWAEALRNVKACYSF